MRHVNKMIKVVTFLDPMKEKRIENPKFKQLDKKTLASMVNTLN